MGRGTALVGRDEQLEALDAEVERVESGAFRVVVVSGAAGVGKTRLVAELLDRRDGGAVRLSARSFRWGATTSFGPWVEALDRHLRVHPPDDIRALGGPFLADLAAILPSVAQLATATSHDLGRGRLLDALAHLLGELSRDQAVLVAFDDLHLADASAWETLRYLGRRLVHAPIGIFATARPAELRSRPISREVLVGLDDDGVLTHVKLGPLRRHELAALAHEVLRSDTRVASSFVPEPLVTWLMDRSLGHPLFAIGLLRALIDEGGDLAAPGLERAPETLRERVALDLQGLEPDDRDVLEMLAVVGRRIDLDGLERICGKPRPALASTLEQLSRAQLVVEHGSRTDLRYEIAHPMIQDTIYEGIGGARRTVLHGTIGREMVAAGELGAAASHFAHAGIRDEVAVDTLFRAMNQAGERDLYKEALAVLEALLDVLPDDDERWVRVLDSITLRSEWVLSHLAEGDADIAIAAMHRVIDVLEGSDDTRARALARFHLAGFEAFGEGRLDTAESACEEAIELFRAAGDLEGELLATNELAWIHGCRGDFEGNAELAREVLVRATDAGLAHPASVAAGTAGFVLGVMGRCHASSEHFARALELSQETANSYRVAWTHAQRGMYTGLCGHLDEAISSCERALSEHPSAPEALAYEDLAHTYWLRGRLSDAVDTLERSAVRRPILGSRRRAWGAGIAARVYAEMGQRGRAVSNLELATTTYDDPFFIWSTWADWSDGWLAWVLGDAPEALAKLDATTRRLRSTGALGYEPLVLADLAEIASDVGEIERSETIAARAAEIADRSDGPMASWLAALVAARHHHLRGDVDATVEQGTEAAQGLDGAGCALLAASAREVVGRAMLSADRGEAATQLKRAASDLAACEAVWRRDRVLATLQGLGSRGRRAAVAVQGPASLTPREREVATLSAQGYTAQEVGERLFIGRRTVETHLANAYAKLGVTSKGELIQRADELGL